jgi:hypothetical protein
MSKKTWQLMIAAVVLIASSLMLLSFTQGPGRARVAGRGTTYNNHEFEISVVKSGGIVSGHYTWDGVQYKVECMAMEGNLVTLYLEGSKFATVVDEGQGPAGRDQVTAPADYDPTQYDCNTTNYETIFENVNKGRVQVR